MKEEQILRKAIEKAVKNGWNTYHGRKFKTVDLMEDNIFIHEQVCFHYEDGSGYYPNDWCVIFNHDFAKALWKDEEGWASGAFDLYQGWEGHLMKMVLEKNPIKYLEKYI